MSSNRSSYEILIECLINCGSLRSAFDFSARARKAFPLDPTFQGQEAILTNRLHSYFASRGDDMQTVDVEDYPEKGLVRRELYPWNRYEPDRTSHECLEFLNLELSCLAPKLEVRVSELPLLTSDTSRDPKDSSCEYVKQLGVFAKEDILPGEQILQEKSLLTGISRLHDSFCDACSVSLPDTQSEYETEAIVSCDSCDEVFFCSTECHDLAQLSYHAAICGVDVDHGKVPAEEAADTLYTLLLLRALALAETQELHPLELKEVRFIWGDYHGQDLGKAWQTKPADQAEFPYGAVPRNLPFSFKSNVLTPLHILEKMDVNIFTSNCYDTWVINTLYAKFRGTASAQQGLDGRPEIGAVHPLWCLANHSCDPNVTWEWQGSMRFWAREKLVDWEGRDPSRKPGISKDEEIFSHYCDVRLPVKERREWAVGALGGECVCQRCVWEEAKQSPRTSAV